MWITSDIFFLDYKLSYAWKSLLVHFDCFTDMKRLVSCGSRIYLEVHFWSQNIPEGLRVHPRKK